MQSPEVLKWQKGFAHLDDDQLAHCGRVCAELPGLVELPDWAKGLMLEFAERFAGPFDEEVEMDVLKFLVDGMPLPPPFDGLDGTVESASTQ
jgi:hypothetical protein